MNPLTQPGNPVSEPKEFVQGQSPRIDKSELNAALEDWFFDLALRTPGTELSKPGRTSCQRRLALGPQKAKNAREAWQAKKAFSISPEADHVNEATVMLAAIQAGDSKAAEPLLVLVYELRRLAASKLAHEAPGQTLQPTALVHEAWLRLVGNQAPSFNNREHFFRASLPF